MMVMTGKKFYDECLTKQAYDDVGPSIARYNWIFDESTV
jgi:hypothetical protein